MNDYTVTVTCNYQEAEDLKNKFGERANVKPGLLEPYVDPPRNPADPTLAGVKDPLKNPLGGEF